MSLLLQGSPKYACQIYGDYSTMALKMMNFLPLYFEISITKQLDSFPIHGAYNLNLQTNIGNLELH